MQLTETDNARIAHFRDTFGEGHFLFACQASVPLFFSTDLLYKLWLNFNTYNSNGKLKRIPQWAVSDMVLSGLTQPVGFQLFRLDVGIRAFLHKKLLSQLGVGRQRELAEFLQQYAEKYFGGSARNIRDIHLLTAQSILDPDAMGKNIGNQLQQKMVHLDKGTGTVSTELVNLLSLYFNLSGNVNQLETGESHISLVAENDPAEPGYISILLPESLQEKVQAKQATVVDEPPHPKPNAVAIVNECLRTSSTVLELGRCGLTDADFAADTGLDLVMRQCTHVEKLILSNTWWEKSTDAWQHTAQNGTKNHFKKLPAAIAAMQQLKVLVCCGDELDHWEIENTGSILTQLEITGLDLGYNNITDFAGVTILHAGTGLEWLDLSHNRISSFNAPVMVTPYKLKSLNLYHNAIETVVGLFSFPILEKLNLGNNNITEPKGFEVLKHLVQLNLSRNKIVDVYPLRNLIKEGHSVHLRFPKGNNEPGIFLFNNPLPESLVELIESNQLLDNYLDTIPLRSAKIYVSGDGYHAANKSLLVVLQDALTKDVPDAVLLEGSVSPGTKKGHEDRISRNLAECDILIALITPSYATSFSNLEELRTATANNKMIIPVLMDKVNTSTLSLFSTLRFLQPPDKFSAKFTLNDFTSILNHTSVAIETLVFEYVKRIVLLIKASFHNEEVYKNHSVSPWHKVTVLKTTGSLKVSFIYKGREFAHTVVLSGFLRPEKLNKKKPSSLQGNMQILYQYIPNPLKELLQEAISLSLQVDNETMQYPWELLTNQEGKFIGKKVAMVRQLVNKEPSALKKSVGNNVLLMFRERALLKAAAKMISTETADIGTLFEENGWATTQYNSNRWSVEKIAEKPYRIVFITTANVSISLFGNSTEGNDFNARTGFFAENTLAALAEDPEIVFIHFNENAYIPKAFQKPGIQIVYNDFKVDQDAAMLFFLTLINYLLRGAQLGDAMQQARLHVADRYEQSLHWAAFQCYGDPHYTLKKDAEVTEETSASAAEDIKDEVNPNAATTAKGTESASKDYFLSALSSLLMERRNSHSIERWEYDHHFEQLLDKWKTNTELQNDAELIERFADGAQSMVLHQPAIQLYEILTRQSHEKKDYPKAISWLTKVHSMQMYDHKNTTQATDTNAVLNLAATCQWLCDLYELNGDLLKAKKFAADALAIVQDLKTPEDDDNRIRYVNVLGHSYLLAGYNAMKRIDLKEAEEMFTKQADLYERMTEKYADNIILKEKLGGAYEDIGNLQIRTNNFDSAITFFDWASKISLDLLGKNLVPEIDATLIASRRLEALADACKNTNDFKSAENYYTQALNVSTWRGAYDLNRPEIDRRGVRLLNKLGQTAIDQNNLSGAAKNFGSAMTIAELSLQEEPGNLLLQQNYAQCHLNLAFCFGKWEGRQNQAAEHLKSAEAIVKKLEVQLPDDQETQRLARLWQSLRTPPV